jgi:hypothetical protein
MRSRRIAAFIAVVLAFASYGAVAATLGLCHKAACCANSGQQVSAPPKCCNESACESAPEVAEAAHLTATFQHAAIAAVAVLAPPPRYEGPEGPLFAAGVTPSPHASIVVLRI